MTDALTLVGDEAALPYQRPPLSKGYLKGEVDEERLYFKPGVWYEDQNIEIVLGTHVTRSTAQTSRSSSATAVTCPMTP